MKLQSLPTFCVLLAGSALVALIISSCQVKVQKHIPVDIKVPIQDPLFHELVGAADRLQVVASGKLIKSSFVTQGTQIDVPEDTKFWLNLSVPVDAQAQLDLRQAHGTLTISAPIRVMGIPTPTAIALDHGQAAAEVDFAKIISAFMIACVQGTDPTPGDSSPEVLASVMPDMQIDSANFDLREGAQIKLPKCSMTIGKNCKIGLSALTLKSNLDYAGFSTMNLHLPKFTMYIPKKKRTITLNDCDLNMDLDVLKEGSRLTFAMHDSDELTGIRPAKRINVIRAQSSRTDNPYGTMTAEQTNIELSDYVLSRSIGSHDLEVQLSGLTNLSKAHLQRTRNGGSIIVEFPVLKSAQFSFDSTSEYSAYDLAAANVDFNNLHWSKTKTNSQLRINLSHGHLESIDLSANEGILLSLSPGQASLQSLEWRNGPRQIAATFAAGSMVTIKKAISLGLSGNRASQVDKLPISIRSGVFKIKNGKENFECQDVSGDFVVTAIGENVQIKGDLSTTLRGRDIGIPSLRLAHTSIKSISIDGDTNACSISLKQCKLDITDEAILKTVADSLPARKTYNVDKMIFAGEKWRYRNLQLAKITLVNPTVNDLRLQKSNSLSLCAGSDMVADGTIERLQILGNDGVSNEPNWRSHPWSATAHLEAEGELSYKFLPGKSLADSTIAYKLFYRIPAPDNLRLNWDKVAQDRLSRAEKAIISTQIKKASYFRTDGVPLSTSGSFKLFTHQDPALKRVQVTSFATIPSSDGLNLQFDAHIGI